MFRLPRETLNNEYDPETEHQVAHFLKIVLKNSQLQITGPLSNPLTQTDSAVTSIKLSTSTFQEKAYWNRMPTLHVQIPYAHKNEL